jgi:hypothetical protein
VSDFQRVVRNILLDMAAGVLLPETPAAAEEILVEEVTGVLGEMIFNNNNDDNNNNDNNNNNNDNNIARHDPPL